MTGTFVDARSSVTIFTRRVATSPQLFMTLNSTSGYSTPENSSDPTVVMEILEVMSPSKTSYARMPASGFTAVPIE